MLLEEEVLKNAANCFQAPSDEDRYSNAISKRELIACARGVCSNSKVFIRKRLD